MTNTLHDLVQHKWYANARFLKAMREREETASDKHLRELMHHVLVANRFWLRLSRDMPFDLERQRIVPESIDALVAQFKDTHIEEADWLATVAESDLAKQLKTPYMPGRTFSVEQGILQICLHSHGHRAQAAVRLRQLGSTPPTLDFIKWLKDRPAVEWS
jgi:uncharacterized damage-inducible protein DinB